MEKNEMKNARMAEASSLDEYMDWLTEDPEFTSQLMHSSKWIQKEELENPLFSIMAWDILKFTVLSVAVYFLVAETALRLIVIFGLAGSYWVATLTYRMRMVMDRTNVNCFLTHLALYHSRACHYADEAKA